MKASEKLSLISQTQDDVDYLLNKKTSCHYIQKILTFWIVGLSLYSIFCFAIDNINIYYQLYNFSFYYPIKNLCQIGFNCILLILLWKSINKVTSLQERRFLKTWFIFPLLISLEQIMSCTMTYINADFLLTFYLTFPMSIIINIIMLFYIHYYIRQKYILWIAGINIAYLIFSFLYSIYYPTLTDVSLLSKTLFSLIDIVKTYLITCILSNLFVVLCIGGEKDEQNIRTI